MRGPKPPVVELSPEEQQGLETLVRRYSTPQQLARRGRIILSAAAGLNNSQIAREVGLDVDTVRFWRNRWLGLQAAILEDLSIEERLRDAPRPGAPARIRASLPDHVPVVRPAVVLSKRSVIPTSPAMLGLIQAMVSNISSCCLRRLSRCQIGS